MKWFWELGDRYARKSRWQDFALVKFCLFSMGILAGMQIQSRHKKAVGIAAGIVFLATYIPLMAKVFGIVKDMARD